MPTHGTNAPARADSDRTGATQRRTVLKSLGAASVTGVTGLAGCAAGGGGNKATFGVISPMHGAYSSLGPFQRKGAKLAIEHVKNSDRYEFEVEAVYGDTETDPSAATQNASKLVQQDGADFVMGAISSSVAIALNSFAADNQVTYSPGAAAIPITGKKCNEWVFRIETNTAQIAETCAAWTLKNLGSDVWFHIADYAYGQSVLREWRSRMKSGDAPFNEVGVTKAKLGTKNFEPYISQIKDSDAKVVVVGSTGGDFVRFVKQARSQGLTEQTDLVTTTASFQVIRAALGASAYGIYSGVRYNANLDTGYNKQFVADYRKAYDDVPGNFARVGYDSIRTMAEGIKAAGSTDPADVKDTLAGMDVPSLFGTNRYRKCDHQAMNPVWVGKNVKPDSGKVADVELLAKRSGSEAITPCSEVACNL